MKIILVLLIACLGALWIRKKYWDRQLRKAKVAEARIRCEKLIEANRTERL